MSDHEFEKKVQQKMDDLRLRPSDAVWAEVERNLRREKRRRRIVLWLPLMGILLTAGGYIIFTTNNSIEKQSLAKTAPAQKTVSPNAATKPSASTALAPVTKTEPDPKPETQSSSSSSSKISTLPVNKPAITPRQNKNLTIAPVRRRQRNQPQENEDIIAKGNRAPKLSSPEKNIDAKQPAQPQVKDKEEAPKTQVDSNAIVYTPTTTPEKKTTEPVVAKKAPAKKKRSSASKWQWGINAQAGMANISEGNLFDVLKSVRVDDLTGAVPQYYGIPPVPRPEASPIRPGAAFTIGAFVQRDLSRRFSVSAGLQYSYFTMHTRVGRKVDSMLAVNYGALNSAVTRGYYSAATNDLHDYVNRYQFIELPVKVSYRVARIKKMPLVLDMGVTYSRLLKTNALLFDGITSVYYENEDFIKKNQLSVNSALNIGLFPNSKHPVYIGPNLRYFASPLVKDEVSASKGEQHIWSFGLNAKMLLKK